MYKRISPYEPGDKLGVGVLHVGIYVGDPYGLGGEYVVDAANGENVRLVSLHDFAGGQVPRVLSRVPWSKQQEVVERALSHLDEPYDPLFSNCEHVANDAQTGVAFSPTVRALMTVAAPVAALGVAWAVSRA